MRVILTTLCLSLTLIGCSGQVEEDHSGHEMMPSDAVTTKGFALDSVTLRPPLPGRDTAMATLSITNQSGQDDRLIAVSSALSEAVEIHTMLNENGVMKMRRLENGIAIAKGETAVLKGGSDHIMLFKTQVPADLKSTELILTFENAGDVRVSAIVDDGTMGDNHSDH